MEKRRKFFATLLGFFPPESTSSTMSDAFKTYDTEKRRKRKSRKQISFCVAVTRINFSRKTYKTETQIARKYCKIFNNKNTTAEEDTTHQMMVKRTYNLVLKKPTKSNPTTFESNHKSWKLCAACKD